MIPGRSMIAVMVAAIGLATSVPAGEERAAARCRASLERREARFGRCVASCERRADARPSFDPERCEAACTAKRDVAEARVHARARCATSETEPPAPQLLPRTRLFDDCPQLCQLGGRWYCCDYAAR